MSADQEEFTNYMASLAETAAREAAIKEAILRHEEWQRTTIMGRFSLFLLSLKNSAFIKSLTSAFRDQQNGTSLNAILLYNIVRIFLIFMTVIVVFVLGRLIQMFIGDEIIVEQTVEIVEEVKRSDIEKKSRRGAKQRSRKEE